MRVMIYEKPVANRNDELHKKLYKIKRTKTGAWNLKL